MRYGEASYFAVVLCGDVRGKAFARRQKKTAYGYSFFYLSHGSTSLDAGGLCDEPSLGYVIGLRLVSDGFPLLFLFGGGLPPLSALCCCRA